MKLAPALILALLAVSLAPITRASDALSTEILQELKALRQQVAALENRVAQLEGQAPTAAAPPAPNAPETYNTPKRDKEVDRLRVALKRAEARDSGPWTEPNNWDRISVGMKDSELIEILGEPTRRKFSVRRDTDEIFYYEGDLTGDGELIQGEIRIYKGKIRRLTAPDFPSS